MKKNLLKLICFFLLGIFGGIFSNQILWPYLVEKSIINEYDLEQDIVYITEKKEITIQENVALQKIIEKVEDVVVGIKTKTEQGEWLKGSGLIITSDGLIITLADLVPKGSNFNFFVQDELVSYQILKRDFENNLALIKVEKSNLQTASFADFEKIKLGERIFLIGLEFNNSTSVNKIVNQGIIRSFNEDFIQTNMLEQNFIKGCPLFNISGEILGLNVLDEKGNVSVIPISKIKEFTGF